MNRINVTNNYQPDENEEYMNEQQLEYFRRKLSLWKNELLNESVETLKNLRDDNFQEADPNDRAKTETDTAFELRTRNRYRKLIEKIDAALQRVDNGEYGYCEETGDEIGLKRLEARPVATLTIEAQEKHEKYKRQHTEEE